MVSFVVVSGSIWVSAPKTKTDIFRLDSNQCEKRHDSHNLNAMKMNNFVLVVIIKAILSVTCGLYKNQLRFYSFRVFNLKI